MKKINRVLLFISGLMPFIIILIVGIYNSTVGFGFPEPTYGLSGFMASSLLISAFIWPLYIVGFLLILKAIKPAITTKKLIITGAILFGVIWGIIFVGVFVIGVMNMFNIADQVQMS